MSTTPIGSGQTTSSETVDTKLEVVTIPVSDIERSKRFYEALGWRLDADFKGDGWRAVQLTPPGSPCSIHLGDTGVPGSAKGMFLIVNDIDAARAELIAKGANVSEPFHFAGIRGPRLAGADPDRGSYRSYAEFDDPDGNTWLLQEITTRFAGRGFSSLDVATLTELLRDAEEHHGQYEATAPKHHWSDWYSAYMVARERGKTADEAATEAGLHMQRDVVHA